MRSIHILATSLCLLASATAQNDLTIYPNRSGSCTTYVTRPSGTSAAEGLIEVNAANFRSVGDQNNGTCQVEGIIHWAVDENRSTSETYHVIIRSEDPVAGGPDTTAAGIISRVGPLSLPTTGSTTRGSWQMRDAFATPAVIGCNTTFFQGIDLPANPLWPASDGHSVWTAYVNPPSSRGVGENPRAGYPKDIAWMNDFSGTPAQLSRTYIIGSLLTTPVLQIGGTDPASCLNGPSACGTANYGLGGLYPDISAARGDGIDIRIMDANAANGTAAALMSGSWTPIQPLTFPWIQGTLWIDPIAMIAVGTSTMSGSTAVIPVALPGTIPPVFVGSSFYFQGLAIDSVSGTFRFTNAQVTEF